MQVISCFSYRINHGNWLERELEVGSRVLLLSGWSGSLRTPWERHHPLLTLLSSAVTAVVAVWHDAEVAAVGLGSCLGKGS